MRNFCWQTWQFAVDHWCQLLVSSDSIVNPVISHRSARRRKRFKMSGGMPELGSKISLISKADIRYEGRLFTVDPHECTIALANGESQIKMDTEHSFAAATFPGYFVLVPATTNCRLLSFLCFICFGCTSYEKIQQFLCIYCVQKKFLKRSVFDRPVKL